MNKNEPNWHICSLRIHITVAHLESKLLTTFNVLWRLVASGVDMVLYCSFYGTRLRRCRGKWNQAGVFTAGVYIWNRVSSSLMEDDTDGCFLFARWRNIRGLERWSWPSHEVEGCTCGDGWSALEHKKITAWKLERGGKSHESPLPYEWQDQVTECAYVVALVMREILGSGACRWPKTAEGVQGIRESLVRVVSLWSSSMITLIVCGFFDDYTVHCGLHISFHSRDIKKRFWFSWGNRCKRGQVSLLSSSQTVSDSCTFGLHFDTASARLHDS